MPLTCRECHNVEFSSIGRRGCSENEFCRSQYPAGKGLEIQVLQSGGGFYIGTTRRGEPICRLSNYFRTKEQAETALAEVPS